MVGRGVLAVLGVSSSLDSAFPIRDSWGGSGVRLTVSERVAPIKKRRGVALAAAGLALATVVGAADTDRRAENDLERRSRERAAELGYDVDITYSGQWANVSCNKPLADSAQLVEGIKDLRGPRAVRLDDGCTSGAAGTGAESTDLASLGLEYEARKVSLAGRVGSLGDQQMLVDAATTALGAGNVSQELAVGAVSAEAADGVGRLAAVIPVIRESMSKATANIDPVDGKLTVTGELLPGLDADLTKAALYDAGRVKPEDITLTTPAVPEAPGEAAVQATVTAGESGVTLAGAVASDAQRDQLASAANAVFGPEQVRNELEVEPGAALTDEIVGKVAALIPSLATSVSDGELGVRDGSLYLNGHYVDDAAASALRYAAAQAGMTEESLDISPRPAATADQAADLEKELNESVGQTPIPFDTGRATLTPAADPILDSVAALARKYGGVTIAVNGYTDGDGDAAANQTLSQARADAVAAALVSRGVPQPQLVSTGFGESQPLVPEVTPADKAKNRRVEFKVQRAGSSAGGSTSAGPASSAQ